MIFCVFYVHITSHLLSDGNTRARQADERLPVVTCVIRGRVFDFVPAVLCCIPLSLTCWEMLHSPPASHTKHVYCSHILSHKRVVCECSGASECCWAVPPELRLRRVMENKWIFFAAASRNSQVRRGCCCCCCSTCTTRKLDGYDEHVCALGSRCVTWKPVNATKWYIYLNICLVGGFVERCRVVYANDAYLLRSCRDVFILDWRFIRVFCVCSSYHGQLWGGFAIYRALLRIDRCFLKDINNSK